MKKILVGINTLTSIDQPVYSNHCQLWFRLGRGMPDFEFGFFTPRRASIDRMRNQTAEYAIAHGFDYICFIDDDVLVPFNGIQKLVADDKDIVAGWTIIRGYPFDNMIFKWNEEKNGLSKWNDLPKTEGILEVGALGFSFALIKTEVLKKMPPPYFVTGPYNTEDVYFCIKAQKYIEGVEVFVDLSVKTAHCLGSDYITPDNKTNFIEFYKKNYPETIESTETGERGNDYLKMVKGETAKEIRAEDKLYLGEKVSV